MKVLKKLNNYIRITMLCMVFYDAIIINFAYFFALWARFDFRYSVIPIQYKEAFFKAIPIFTILSIIIFVLMKIYQSVWKFASYYELVRIVIATFLTTILQVVLMFLLKTRMPISYYIFGSIIQMIGLLMIRFSYRLVLLLHSRKESEKDYNGQKVMIIGGGSAGRMIIRDLNKTQHSNLRPLCIIDDDPNKLGLYIEGIPIVGNRDDILLNVEKYQIDQILYAIPTAEPEDKKEILNICKESGRELKVLPGLYQLVNGEVTLSQFKEVAIEDLLGRDSIQVNMSEIFEFLENKKIMVTGGGGSIGSELCRQIAAHHPKQLIIFDIYENNAYEIEQDLKRNYPQLNLKVLIGSVRDSRRINQVFETYQPDIVYHAAAHKHVPLMETSPCEAIKNNVMGTYKTACAALKNGCQRFVLISTDKAVNPTNIMGASKRLCEMVIQSMDIISRTGRYDILPFMNNHPLEHHQILTNQETKRTEFVAVRFGNVLGSNGSVIPLFKKQIANGGPVTVTHPDIIRYFMTIPEAVSLVLQAGTYAKGGEIFVLDMGAPVKIVSLAKNLIKLSGLKPDIDIKIQYTGLRPGEKLYEEKLMDEEGMEKTPNDLIHIGKPLNFDVEQFMKQLEVLAKESDSNNSDIREIVKAIVPTYHDASLDIKINEDKFKSLYEEAQNKGKEELYV